MVVADRLAQEIILEAGRIHHYLGTAQHAFILVVVQYGLRYEGSLEVGRDLEDGGRTFEQLPVHGHSES